MAAANKRVANILSKNSVELIGKIETSLLGDEAEIRLYEALNHTQREVDSLVLVSDYIGALNRLAELREPIDNFFESVMVMVEDETVRKNRLGILLKLRQLFLSCGDISLLSK